MRRATKASRILRVSVLRIDAVVLVEARILAGDEGVDEIPGDLVVLDDHAVLAGVQARVEVAVHVEDGAALRHLAELFEVEGPRPHGEEHTHARQRRDDE